MAIYWQKFSTFFYANYINLSIVLTVLITHAAAFEREHFVYWPNGTVPFYVNPTHFDKEQSLEIQSALSLFAQKTCLRFSQVEEPRLNQHVMVLENPRGVRRCVLNTEGHAREEPHKVTVGYSCLRGPDLQMIIMRALGFPFEHNRAIRDLYIDVQFENIEPGFILFFTKEKILPLELRNLPYDVDSVMHFGERDYSKNGHRSFIFKNQQTQQSRIGLSKMDLRKIEIIYGPECQKRDRQAKIDICKKYPSVRIKREIDIDIDKVQNLRANRDITPPSETNLISEQIIDSVKELNIDEEVQGLIEQVHKITASALENERLKICNNTNNTNTKISDSNRNNISHTLTYNNNVGSDDLTKIIEVIISHVKAVVSHAQTNLTVFCGTTNSIELFQRAKCGWGSDFRCSQSFKSIVSRHMKYSTKRRPFIKQSTKRGGRRKIRQYASWFKSGNDTQEIASNTTSRRRDVETLNITHNLSNDEVKINNNLKIAIDDTEKSINSSRRKKETKILNNTYLNNVAMGYIDSSVPIGNNTGESSAIKRMRRKRGTETSSSTDLTDVTTKTNASFVSTVHNPKKSINDPKTRKKREDDTIIISDIIINVTQNSRESLITNTTEEVKESVMKPVNDLNINGSKDTLRMATRMLSDQKVDFTPVRRNDRDDREFGESEREVKSDESSSSSERDKRKRKTTKTEHSRGADISYESDRDIEERGDKRERERNRDREKDRPLKKSSKGKRGNRRPLLPETVPLTRGNKEFYADRIWPEGVVRYVIAQDSAYNLRSMRARLAEVNDILKRKTCVRVEEISESEGQRYEDYLVIDTSADYVTGRVGGRQNFGSIELFEGGQHRQHAAMMVMAMLGFYFEPARHDRDRYVRVHNRHIRPDKLHHFEKIRADATLGLPYDYASATHPAWQFWRRVGRSGISTVATYKDQDPDGSIMKSLGQNEQLLSDVDIIKINSVYGVQCFQNKRRMKMQPKGETNK